MDPAARNSSKPNWSFTSNKLCWGVRWKTIIMWNRQGGGLALHKPSSVNRKMQLHISDSWSDHRTTIDPLPADILLRYSRSLFRLKIPPPQCSKLYRIFLTLIVILLFVVTKSQGGWYSGNVFKLLKSNLKDLWSVEFPGVGNVIVTRAFCGWDEGRVFGLCWW